MLLNSAPKIPKLPLFLKGKTWVDFRSQSPNPFSQLIWGITGERKAIIDDPIITIPDPTTIKANPITIKPDSITTETKKLEWVGDWFVHVGEGETRTWADCVKYGFISAGQGVRYSGSLKKLEIGSTIYAYMAGLGYVGLGKVIQKAIPIKDFTVGSEKTPLLEVELQAKYPGANSDNLALSEWVVGVKWLKTFPKEQARRFVGAFANQNIACKLTNKATLEFLREEFGWAGDWFVNVGEGNGQRAWEDCVRYEFMSAGQGARFANAIKKAGGWQHGLRLYRWFGLRWLWLCYRESGSNSGVQRRATKRTVA